LNPVSGEGKMAGGILRINPMTMNGAVNTIGAKVDF
jgi:hypothetical protein